MRDEVVVEPPAARAPGVEAPANPCARREVRSQWIYTPDQSYVALARAWPRRAEQLETTIAYCIDTGGKVDGIELERSSGVDAIDQAALDVIAKWRAKPHMIDGAPARACSALTFTVRAIRPRRHDED